MAPILINQSDFAKFGLFLLLALALTFTGGFIAGQHQASSAFEKNKSNDSMPLSIESGSQQADVNNMSVKDMTVKDRAVKDMTVDLTTTKVIAADVGHTTEPETEPVSNSVSPTKESVAAVITKDRAVLDVSSSTNSPVLKNKGEIKYSIQVAVYGSLKNAEKMMKKLQKKHLDAYISDYVSKQNHVRFNVRFGFFRDKKSAKDALQDYSDNQQGDGYLVNFSADNIVKFAQDISVEDVPATHENAV